MKAAGSAVTVSVLQNVYAEEMVHQALPEAKVDQYDSVDLMYQALNSGRADAAATDASSLKWFMLQNPDKYLDSGYGWNPQTYACAVKRGEADWLNFVNTALARGDDRRRIRDLQRVVPEMVRRGAAGPDDRLPRGAAVVTPIGGRHDLRVQLQRDLGQCGQSPRRIGSWSGARPVFDRRSARRSGWSAAFAALDGPRAGCAKRWPPMSRSCATRRCWSSCSSPISRCRSSASGWASSKASSPRWRSMPAPI